MSQQDYVEAKRKIEKQQKGHSELLASVKASITKLEARGKELVVENLPLEKQVAPLTFFIHVSPAGGITTQCSQEFITVADLKALAEAMSDCAKDFQNSRARSRLALHASGKQVTELSATLGISKKRKPSRTSRLQKAVQQHFKSRLQSQCEAACQDALAEKLANGIPLCQIS